MKLSQFKNIVKEAVKEAIQEEMKEILLEAIKVPKTKNKETISQPLPESDKAQLRENMMNVLDGMRPGANGNIYASSADVPMKVTPGTDTMSDGGKLPEGSVSMDQISKFIRK